LKRHFHTKLVSHTLFIKIMKTHNAIL
jgi:hypothetical protein